jgi:hypothetical protein
MARAECRAVAEAAVDEALRVDLRRQRLRRIRRPAAGEALHLVEHAQAVDRQQRDGDREGRRQQRERHLAQSERCGCTVDRGRFVELLRDGLQAGQV